MLLAHSLCTFYVLQVPRVHAYDCINKVCWVHYYITFITTAFFPPEYTHHSNDDDDDHQHSYQDNNCNN